MNILAKAWGFSEIASHHPSSTDRKKFTELDNSLDFFKLENNEDYAFVANFNEEIIVSFAGTKNLRAFISDFDPYPLRDDFKNEIAKAISLYKATGGDYYSSVTSGLLKEDPKWGRGTIHDGFYTAWTNFKQPIREYLAQYPDKSVYFVGHSRGGSIAPLGARDQAKNAGRSCSCIAFGAPRVFTKDGRDQMNALAVNYTNVHHGYEFTKFLPPRCLSFRHAGRFLWLEEPFIHRLFHKIRDHYYSTTTQAIMKLMKQKDDSESYDYLKSVVLPRCVV